MSLEAAIQIIVAIAALASVIVAYGAYRVATAAKEVAQDSVQVAEQSVETARRQVALAAVPYVVADAPNLQSSSRSQKLRVQVTNSGNVPVIALRVEVEGCRERFVPIEETRVRSNALANLAPGQPANPSIIIPESMRTAGAGGVWEYPFLVVRIVHHGPHGARVVQSYDWNTASKAWRYRVIDIDPGDGGESIHVELSL